ncbi:MAG: flagellar hook assembly protein FlgD [Pseudomonadota bacterium]
MTDPVHSSLLSIPGLAQQGRTDNDADSSGELGQADFLRLMTAQLEAQDPFNPQDSGEFLSQLAEFGTVSGIQDLQDSFTDLSNSLQSLQALQASTLVGRSVLLNQSSARLDSGGTITGDVAAGAANNVTVSVLNAAGVLVHQETLDVGADGSAPFSWDGTGFDGTTQPAGVYQVSAQGTLAGEPVALEARTVATVDSVSIGAGGIGLTLNIAGLGSVNATDVLEIR